MSWRHHDVTLKVQVVTTITFRISGETNDTDSILMSISPDSRLKNPKIDKRIYVELTHDLESDCDVTISVTCRIYSTAYTWQVIDIGVDRFYHIQGRGTWKSMKLFM